MKTVYVKALFISEEAKSQRHLPVSIFNVNLELQNVTLKVNNLYIYIYIYNWRASEESETLSGLTQSGIFVCLKICVDVRMSFCILTLATPIPALVNFTVQSQTMMDSKKLFAQVSMT